MKTDGEVRTRRERIRHRALAGLALWLVPLLLAGCGGAPEGKVKGKVTYQGAPLTEGVVNFLDSSKGAAATANLEDGAFQFPGSLPPGKYKVYFSPPVPAQLPPGTPAPAPKPFPLPPKYMDENQTPVVKEVQAGENDIAIDLTE